MEKVSINYEKLAERMYELYITKNYPFITQNQDGAYKWRYDLGSLKENNYNVLVRHLQSKQTVGVFCHTHTKFIDIDVDFKNDIILAKWTTLKIIDVLKEFGICDKFINVSFSGYKGYHILIFFDSIVSFKQIQFLYDLVLEEIYYSVDYDNLQVNDKWHFSLEQLKEKIELRPTPNIGVKLELSIHQVTKNKCYFCDNVTLDTIKSIEYLYEIQQFPRKEFEMIIDNGKEHRKERKNIDYFNKEIKQVSKPAKSQKLYTDEDFTIEYIENLIQNGLQIEGSRHNSLMKIARYYYHFGNLKDETENLLIKWMLKQNHKYYTSNEIEWRKDIKNIVTFVYKSGRGMNGKVRDITINKDEMLEILKHKEKPKKLLFYALIIHAKRYAIKNGEFYMTYEQIMESIHISDKTITKYLKELSDEREIIITRQNEKSNNYKNLPNKYIINNIKISTTNTKQYIIKDNIIELEKEYDNTVINLFTKEEIKTLMPDKQYRILSKLYSIA